MSPRHFLRRLWNTIDSIQTTEGVLNWLGVRAKILSLASGLAAGALAWSQRQPLHLILIFGILAMGAFLVVLFIGHEVYWSVQERRLSGVRTEAAARREAARGILEHAEFAVNRLFHDPQGDSAYNLRCRIDAWERQLYAFLESCPYCLESEKSAIRVISPYVPRGFSGRTTEHVKIREELMEKIERLRRIAERIERERPSGGTLPIS